jgi:hypothetical protein
MTATSASVRFGADGVTGVEALIRLTFGLPVWRARSTGLRPGSCC